MSPDVEDGTTDPETGAPEAGDADRRGADRRIDREIADIARDWLDDQTSSERRRRDALRTALPVFRP